MGQIQSIPQLFHAVQKLPPPPPPPPPPRYNIQLDNQLQYLKNNVKNSKTHLYTVKNINNVDPANGCPKNFLSTYKCGTSNQVKQINIPKPSYGKTATYDCTSENKICINNKLILDDSCNLIMVDSSGNEQVLWKPGPTYNLSLLLANKTYNAANSKYKRNYLLTGEYLLENEFIGSPSGKCILILKKYNGKLFLNIYGIISGCYNYYNTPNKFGYIKSKAIYSMNPINRTDIGKLFYVDMDTQKKMYPNNMISLSNTYTNVGKYDSSGNNISIKQNTNLQTCKKDCNVDKKCLGFVFDNKANVCYLKNDKMWPKNPIRTPNSNMDLYIRNPLINNQKCSNNISEINLDIMNKLPLGSKMTTGTLCNMYYSLSKQKKKVHDKEIALTTLINEINNEVKNLTSTEQKLDSDVINYIKKIQSDLSKYNNLNNSNNSNTSNNISDLNDLNDLYTSMVENTIIILNTEKNKIILNSVIIILTLMVAYYFFIHKKK